MRDLSYTSFADRRGLEIAVYRPGNETGHSVPPVQTVALCSKQRERGVMGMSVAL